MGNLRELLFKACGLFLDLAFLRYRLLWSAEAPGVPHNLEHRVHLFPAGTKTDCDKYRLQTDPDAFFRINSATHTPEFRSYRATICFILPLAFLQLLFICHDCLVHWAEQKKKKIPQISVWFNAWHFQFSQWAKYRRKQANVMLVLYKVVLHVCLSVPPTNQQMLCLTHTESWLNTA